jgi:hypothetical protein
VDKVNIREKLALLHDHWSPTIVGELNGQHGKLVKFQGEFVWHKHDHEDELFLVVKGRFRMEFRDRHVWQEPLEMEITTARDMPCGRRAVHFGLSGCLSRDGHDKVPMICFSWSSKRAR